MSKLILKAVPANASASAEQTLGHIDNFVTGQDVLGFTANASTMGNIAGTYNATTGVMSLTSSGNTATLAQWQAALQAVTYSNSSDAPSTLARTISYVVNDGTTNSAAVTNTVNVSAANDAPTLGGTATAIGYTENGAAAAIHTAITVADLDNTTLANATVSITGNFVTGQDVLGFTANASTMGNIAGTYNATTGVMSLTSSGNTATLAQWQTALRAVTYSNSSDNPSTLARTISYVVNDGATNSTAVTNTVNVSAANDSPTGTVSYSGTAKVGTVLTATNNLVDPDGLGTINYIWQTQAAGAGTWANVGTGANYLPTAGDLGKSLRVQASYTDLGGTLETISGTPTTVTVAPYIKSVAVTDTTINLTFDQDMGLPANYPTIASFGLFFNATSAQTITAINSTADSKVISLSYTNTIGIPWSTNRSSMYLDLVYNDTVAGDGKALHSSTGVEMDPFTITILSTQNNAQASAGSRDGMNNYVMGSGGDDNVIGGSGSDYLWGGDTLGAAKGNNTFKWTYDLFATSQAGDIDTIKDFTKWNGSSGDKLSLTGLFTGGYVTTRLSDWITSVATGQTVNGVANSTVMTIDIDGSGGGTATQTIQIEGVDLFAGLTASWTLDLKLNSLYTSNVII